jgi:hypothetical protein
VRLSRPLHCVLGCPILAGLCKGGVLFHFVIISIWWFNASPGHEKRQGRGTPKSLWELRFDC